MEYHGLLCVVNVLQKRVAKWEELRKESKGRLSDAQRALVAHAMKLDWTLGATAIESSKRLICKDSVLSLLKDYIARPQDLSVLLREFQAELKILQQPSLSLIYKLEDSLLDPSTSSCTDGSMSDAILRLNERLDNVKKLQRHLNPIQNLDSKERILEAILAVEYQIPNRIAILYAEPLIYPDASPAVQASGRKRTLCESLKRDRFGLSAEAQAQFESSVLVATESSLSQAAYNHKLVILNAACEAKVECEAAKVIVYLENDVHDSEPWYTGRRHELNFNSARTQTQAGTSADGARSGSDGARTGSDMERNGCDLGRSGSAVGSNMGRSGSDMGRSGSNEGSSGSDSGINGSDVGRSVSADVEVDLLARLNESELKVLLVLNAQDKEVSEIFKKQAKSPRVQFYLCFIESSENGLQQFLNQFLNECFQMMTRRGSKSLTAYEIVSSFQNCARRSESLGVSTCVISPDVEAIKNWKSIPVLHKLEKPNADPNSSPKPVQGFNDFSGGECVVRTPSASALRFSGLAINRILGQIMRRIEKPYENPRSIFFETLSINIDAFVMWPHMNPERETTGVELLSIGCTDSIRSYNDVSELMLEFKACCEHRPHIGVLMRNTESSRHHSHNTMSEKNVGGGGAIYYFQGREQAKNQTLTKPT